MIKKRNKLTPLQYHNIIEKVFTIPYYGTSVYKPFVLNDIQKRFLYEMDDRNIVLKSRKHGMSTLVLALFLIDCNEHSNHHSAMLANSDINTLGIFDKAKQLIRTARGYTFQCEITKKGIEFPQRNSWIQVSTAGAKAAFRGGDLHAVHFSELAFFEHPDVYTAATEACPKDALIIMESTANGRNGFYDMWNKSIDGYPKKYQYKPFFFPWYEHPDNTQIVPQGKVFSASEKDFQIKYKLSNEQLYWFSWKKSTMIDPDLFLQEHPTTAEEAFIASGRPIFSQDSLKRMKDTIPPYRIGCLELNSQNCLHFFDGDKNHEKEMKLFKEPEINGYYIISADIAEGKEHGDFNAAQVYKFKTREQVAEMNLKCDPDQFAFKLNQLGRYYNTAFIIPELNNPGHSVVSLLHNYYNYPKLYREEVEDNAMVTDFSETIGFRTNKSSKENLITLAKRSIRLGAVRVNSPECIEQLLAYERNMTGQATAPKGKHDDLVIAFMLANFILFSDNYNYLAKAGVAPGDELEALYYRTINKSSNIQKSNKTTGY